MQTHAMVLPLKGDATSFAVNSLPMKGLGGDEHGSPKWCAAPDARRSGSPLVVSRLRRPCAAAGFRSAHHPAFDGIGAMGGISPTSAPQCFWRTECDRRLLRNAASKVAPRLVEKWAIPVRGLGNELRFPMSDSACGCRRYPGVTQSISVRLDAARKTLLPRPKSPWAFATYSNLRGMRRSQLLRNTSLP